jgi:hypothetical protein
MRSRSSQIILTPPDSSGLLAAAALRRRLAGGDVALVWPHELSRRVAALADEPGAARTSVIDLVPTDSVQSLLIPSLRRLADQGLRAVWYYGRDEPAPALQALGDLVAVRYEEGAHTWRLACAERDKEFRDYAEAIESGSDERGIGWRLVLRALTTSWDWTRIYGSLDMLVELQTAVERDVAWAREQLAEAERAESLVARAEVRHVGGTSIAVITDYTIPARVRPEIFRELRGDVDALAFVGGPGRLVIVLGRAGESPVFLRKLSADPVLSIGSLAGPRIDVAWRPGRVPESVARLLGRRIFESIEAEVPVTESARITHTTDERIAKGLHASRLDTGDREALLEGIREHVRDEGRKGRP